MLFTSWYDDVLIDVTGCQPELALKHIRQAAIEFCDQSKLLVKDCATGVTVAMQAAYTPAIPTGYDTVLIIDVFANGVHLESKSRDDLIGKYGDITAAYGAVKYYYQESLDKIILCPIPDSTGTLMVKAAIKPNRTSTGVDDWVGIKHFDAIAHGAKARLFEIPGKPWSNPQLAGYHASQFSSAASAARRSASMGMARSPSRTKLW